MKVNTKWNLGNFTVALSADVNEKVDQSLRNLGLLYLGQRVSKVDRILGGFKKEGEKFVRITGWKRTDTDYKPDLAASLAEAFAELEVEEGVKIQCESEVSQYDGPAKAEPKYAREKKKFSEKESTPEGLEKWLAGFAKYTGATHGADGEYSVEALAAAKLAIDKFLAKNI